MNNAQTLAAILALPDPDYLHATRLSDPIGSGASYSARTVVRLLADRDTELRALVAKWRGHWSTQMLSSSDKEAAATGAAIEDCADELEQWLDGKKPNAESTGQPRTGAPRT